MFIVKCPGCRKNMKYAPRNGSKSLEGKTKKCVYCGRSFTVHSNIKKSRIIKKL